MAKRIKKTKDSIISEKAKKIELLQNEIKELTKDVEVEKSKKILVIFKETKLYELSTEDINNITEQNKEKIISFFNEMVI